jgi:hypothetical protein
VAPGEAALLFAVTTRRRILGKLEVLCALRHCGW